MLALALLASHLVGDFVLQTRWQAQNKLDDWRVRLEHVLTYLIPFYVLIHLPLFLPIPIRDADDRRAWVFFGALGVLHFLTDTRRFHSTLGDLVAWRHMPDETRRALWEEQVAAADRRTRERFHLGPASPGLPDVPDSWLKVPPPNPWPAIPLMIDQTLHVVQLAALGWLLV